MSECNSEVKELRVAATIGVLLIVFGHSFITADYTGFNPQWYRDLKDFIYGFHVHLFFFLSGFLLAYKYEDQRLDLVLYYKSRFTRLIVPYLFFSIVNLVLNFSIEGITDYPVKNVEDAISTLIYPTTNTIKFHWFLVVLFSLCLLAPVILWLLKRGWLIVSLAVCLAVVVHLEIPKRGLMFLGLSFSAHYLVFFLVGSIVQRRFRLFDRELFREHPGILFLFFISVSLCFYAIERWFFEVVPGNSLQSLFGMFFAFSAIFSIMAVSQVYVQKCFDFLDCLFGMNLSILLMSWYGHRLADGILNRFLDFSFAIVMPISFLIGIGLPCLVVRFASGRGRWLDILLGCPTRH